MKKIKHIILGLYSIVVMMLLLTSCSTKPSEIETIPPTTDQTEEKILIAYFTWADNTHVENPDTINPDASTSASVLAPGNTAIMATYIRDAVGGDLFSMIVEEPYSSNYDECLDRAADEKAANARPTIINSVESIVDYDIIFLGYPNWWYTVPMAIHSFLESYDFSGNIIIPFCAHGTGGLASSVRDIERSLDDDVTFITNAFGVYRPNTIGCRPQINDWLEQLGFDLEQ